MLNPDKVSLMIVEDDANIRYLLEAAALRAEAYEPIATAPNGRLAFEALSGWESHDLPEFIVTDLTMPEMNGLELVRALKNDPRLRTIPVAVITSSDLPNDREDALRAGVCAFVTKPYGLDAMTKALLSLRETYLDAVRTTHAA